MKQIITLILEKMRVLSCTQENVRNLKRRNIFSNTWLESVVAYFKVLSQNSPLGTDNIYTVFQTGQWASWL
jgi:hypothetical protein